MNRPDWHTEHEPFELYGIIMSAEKRKNNWLITDIEFEDDLQYCFIIKGGVHSFVNKLTSLKITPDRDKPMALQF